MLEHIERPVRWLVIVAFAVMVAAAIAQVLSRYVFNYPLGWTEELAKLAMTWWTFLAVAILAVRRRLLAIDALLLALPPRPARALAAATQFVALIGGAWLTWEAARLVGLAGSQITSALNIPYAYVYLSLPVGLAGASAGFLLNLVLDLRALVAGEVEHPVRLEERSEV